MKAVALVQRRVVVAAGTFAEIVVWSLPDPLPPSTHRFEYRLAYIAADECVVLYDNERGKGDHRHFAGAQEPYKFISPDQLIEDFSADIERWNRENRRT